LSFLARWMVFFWGMIATPAEVSRNRAGACRDWQMAAYHPH
jgi:hypothetical protein